MTCRNLRRTAKGLLIGGMMFSGCNTLVDFPGGKVDISDDGVFVKFLGIHVEVTDDRVFVDVPGIEVTVRD